MSKPKNNKKVTEQDFIGASTDENVNKFMKMLSNNLYAFRVKYSLYKEGKIGADVFLYSENVYDLPLAKKNGSKGILIDTSLLDIFDRYLLVEEMIAKGDALTAFVVEHDDSLYNVIKENTVAEVRITSQEYIQIFSRAYNSLSDSLLDSKINKLFSQDDALVTAALMKEGKVVNVTDPVTKNLN